MPEFSFAQGFVNEQIMPVHATADLAENVSSAGLALRKTFREDPEDKKHLAALRNNHAHYTYSRPAGSTSEVPSHAGVPGSAGKTGETQTRPPWPPCATAHWPWHGHGACVPMAMIPRAPGTCAAA